MSAINPNQPQLFAVLDTCSIVKNTEELIDFVINIKQSFPDNSPILFIISLTVLEELDKCNRPSRRKLKNNQEKNEDIKLSQTKDLSEPPIDDILNRKQPPRSFMRFIEEEVRVGHVLMGELDPFKTTKLPPFEIVNKDDRILECCLRSAGYIRSQPHHPDTRLVLITEDNIFKTKATTFGVPSFRWREFMAKYHNFGKRNCVPTPLVPSRTNPINKSPQKLQVNTSERTRQSKSDVTKKLVSLILANDPARQTRNDEITVVKEVITIDCE